MAGGKRQGAGRKAVKIELEDVEKLCVFQPTDAELASFFSVDVSTIARRKKQPDFAETMERGKARGLLTLRRYLWASAAKGNVAACIFLAKNLLDYKDVVANVHSGPGGGPIRIGPAPELKGLSDDEIKQLSVLVGKAAATRTN
jgi:hypothetical protein